MRALVTGAGGSIGGAIVEQLLADGWNVIAHDITVERVAHLADMGADTLASDLLTGPVQVDGALDTVIAAHGIEASRAIAATTDEWVARVMAVNSASLEALLTATLPALSRVERATFVVVGSQAGLIGEANNSIYCASKFAAVAWATDLAAEVRKTHHVALRVLCPGCTESTLLFNGLRGFAEAEGIDPIAFTERRKAHIPAGRFATAAETAAAAVYLAEPLRTRPALLAATGGEVLW